MKKHIQSAICAVIISLSLFGCGKQTSAEPAIAPDSKEATVTPFATSSENNTHIGNTETPPAQKVTQEISENLTIDAEVFIPGKSQYSTYTLKMVDCDPDRLFGIFSPEGYGSYTTEDRGYGNGGYVLYHESNGKKLVVYEDSIRYSAFDTASSEVPLQEVRNLMYYHAQEYPQAAPHDLSFMTVAEMETLGKDLLAQIGSAWEPELFKCVTLSGQEIMDFQKEMLEKNWYTDSSPMTLTEAEDTCYLEFKFTYDGLPLLGSDEPTVTLYNNWMPTPTVTATMMLNGDGLQDCAMSIPCTVEAASEPQTVLSLEEAMGVLKDKYDLEILFDSLKITEAWMEYIPVKQDQSLVLTPYWCFKDTDDALVGTPGYYGNASRFNAITGKDLAYGG